MAEIDEKIDQLQTQLENLIRTQIGFQKEVSRIQYEINVLRGIQQKRNPPVEPASEPKKPPVREFFPPPIRDRTLIRPQPEVPNDEFSDTSEPDFQEIPPLQPARKSDLEKFIGENLISKIGILVLVIGVAIGAKYAIDNQLIGPLMRIVLGYVCGFGLLIVAAALKEKYLNFSAVLLSGAVAVLYFITYFAYSLYELFSQPTAFALMLILTAFSVTAAINYNRQVIAHFGLVGAYAIPFLLSDDSGKYAFLFTYIAIINAGILAVSLKKYWKSLFYSSFLFTWLIYSAWLMGPYETAAHFNLALTFLSIFFLIFYLTFIGYKLISKENVALENVTLILSNSFIFYGLGTAIISGREGFEDYPGVFTVTNAAIHFGFALAVSRFRSFPPDMLYLLAALVITFATIAIPVQLDGHWVTLVWTAEAGILFWLGRARQIPLYEYFSFPLMLLASVSLLQDWVLRSYDWSAEARFSLFEGNFVTSLFYAVVCGFIFLTNRNQEYETAVGEPRRKPFGYLIAAVGLGVFYNAFRIEIGNYFNYRIASTAAHTISLDGEAAREYDFDLGLFNLVWQINYTMFFLSVLAWLNIKRFKNTVLAITNLVLKVFVLLIFITVGLLVLGELRESYLLQSEAINFNRGIFHILIRYVSYAFAAGLLFAGYRYIKQEFLTKTVPEHNFQTDFDLVFYPALLVIASSELITWMDISGYQDSYKLGLSILWGVYALILIALGIYYHKKHLRIGAIGLFGLTLAKLFFYDIAHLNTISKTIVMVSLGILMLIVSFLYNKYKAIIFETSEL